MLGPIKYAIFLTQILRVVVIDGKEVSYSLKVPSEITKV